MFEIFIISLLDNDPDKRADRLRVHNDQLDCWLSNTSIKINVYSMNYEKDDYRTEDRIVYHDLTPRKANEARYEAFKDFYASQADWGIMMDNDASLYCASHHNSSYKLFAEMEQNLEAYKSVGIFQPINPGKQPFNHFLNDELHTGNHVFVRNMDLKGSMMVVRNFRKHGQPEVWPDVSYVYSDDIKIALDAVKLGHHVMTCRNIVLREPGLKSSSHATGAKFDRKPLMKAANLQIIADYGDPSLTMSKAYPHCLDRKQWLKKTWMGDTKLYVPKPQSPDSKDPLPT